MNIVSKSALAARLCAVQAMKAAAFAMRKPNEARKILNRYEGGRLWQNGDRSYIWSPLTDARFDADQATRSELVRKARYFEANSPLIQRIADLWEQYIVGANGLMLSPDSSDEEWNNAAADWFEEWGASPDVTSLQSWPTLQGLIARTWLIDGEVFVLLTRDEKNPSRPMLRLIEGHRVCSPEISSPRAAAMIPDGHQVIDGVEVNRFGRPVAYWIRNDSGAERKTTDEVLHIFEPSRAGMYRGLTHFYAVMNALHDLSDLELLEMQSAKDAAETTKVIKTPTGDLLDDAAQWDRQTEAGSGEQNPLTEYYQRVFGATTKVMKTGDEYEQITSSRPSVAQQWYWKYLTEKVCSGVGVPIVLVYPDSMQGTVYRGVLDSANAFFRSRSAVLASAFRRVWTYVIGTAARSERKLANLPQNWTRLNVRPPRAVNVDVGRNSSAMLAELAGATRTYQDIFGETGEDWKQKLRQKAQAVAYINKIADEFKVEPSEISDVMKEPAPAQQAPEAPQKKGEV